MERIKKIRSWITLASLAIYFSPKFAFAVQLFDDPTGEPSLKAKDVTKFVANIRNIIASVASVVAVAMLIWGAFYLVTGQGNEERITKGKTIIRKALMGFILIIAAGFFVSFFIMALGGNVEGVTGSGDTWF